MNDLTFAGPECTLAGTCKLPYGHTPVMLYGGDLTCQTQSGKVGPHNIYGIYVFTGLLFADSMHINYGCAEI